MRVFVLTIFSITLLLCACDPKSRSHRKIPLKNLEADIAIEIDTSRIHSIEEIHKEE